MRGLELSRIKESLGIVHEQLGHIEAALELYEESLAIKELILGLEHPLIAGSSARSVLSSLSNPPRHPQIPLTLQPLHHP